MKRYKFRKTYKKVEGSKHCHWKTAHSPYEKTEILIKRKRMLIKLGILSLIPRRLSI